MPAPINFELLNDDFAIDRVAIKNARWLAARCRERDEVVMPAAAMIAEKLAAVAGMEVEVYGMEGGALAELIDHLADRAEKEMAGA